MSLTATARKTATLLTTGPSSGLYGTISQANGKYIAGVSESPDTFPPFSVSHWYVSNDQGRTWSATTTENGIYGEDQRFSCNVTDNILLAPYAIPSTNSEGIMRSTDGGNTFSSVFLASPAGAPPSGAPGIFGIQTFQRTHAIAWGLLDGNTTPPAKIYALSSDSGAHWTPVGAFDPGDQFDIANAVGVAELGTVFMQYTKFGGVNRTSNFARSDDFTSSWTVLSAPPGGTATPPNLATAITCFDPTHLAMCGVVFVTPAASTPGVWWSDDAGASLNRLSSSDIDDWPTGSGNEWCYEVKRLTRDACILAVSQENAGPGSPWRISLDQGHTYPISVTPDGTSWQLYQIPFGKIVTTRDGGILALLWQSEDYSTVELSAFRIEIHC